MTPVYIAAPLRAPTPEAMAAHVRRACALSLYAVTQGLAPVCVHPGVAAGAYGDEASPTDRARGIEVARALAALVARAPGGKLWIVARGDGTLSGGCAREHAAFLLARATTFAFGARRVPEPLEGAVTIYTWAAWVERMRRDNFDVPGGL